MRILLHIVCLLIAAIGFAQSDDLPFDPMHWKLELPTGYKASDWKLSNFQNDRFAHPFFYLDSIDGALVMEAYPAEGKSTAKYTKNRMREQVQPGSSEINWTFKEGGVLEAEIQVVKMSQENGKYHKTILLELDGRTSEKQNEKLGLEKSKSFPLVKIFWENERIKVVRKALKEETTVGDALLLKDAWTDDKARYSNRKVGNDKFKIRISAEKNKLEIQIDDERPILFRDTSIRQWYLENYFVAGNYLQSKAEEAHCIVKYFNLKVTHE